MTMEPPILRSSTRIELLSDAAGAIKEYKTNKKQELLDRINRSLGEWKSHIQDNKVDTQRNITLRTKERLKEYETTFREFLDEAVEAQALRPVLSETVKLCKELAPQTHVVKLANEALTHAFYAQNSFATVLDWGATYPKTKEVLCESAIWQNHPLMIQLLSAPANHPIHADFCHFLARCATSEDGAIQALSRHLATYFFNQATDTALSGLVNRASPEEKALFFASLQRSELCRTSLSLSASFQSEKWLLSALPMLERLNLREMPGITDEDLLCLAQIKELKSLNLHSALISAKTLQSLATNCPKLEELSLESCSRLRGADLQHLGRCTNLQSILLKQIPKVSDNDLEFLRSLHQLSQITLSYQPDLKGIFLLHLAPAAATLERVSVENCVSVADVDLHTMPPLPKLHTLAITKAKISDTMASALVLLASNARHISFEESRQLTGALLQTVCGCHSLQTLNCSGFKSITDEQFARLHGLLHLEKLNLAASSGFTASAFAHTRLPSLKELDLSRCSSLQEEHLSSLASCAPILQKLNLSSNPALKSGIAFLKQLKELKELILRSSQMADIKDITALANQLEALDLSQNTLSQEAIESSIGALVKLKRLGMLQSAHISDAFLASLAALEALEFLDISHSPKLTTEGIQALQQKNSKLTIIHSLRRTPNNS